jgi:pimeloyl-ACP methyl ester carboxylesterase
MSKVNINGVAVHYEVHGAGQPLVLIHHGIGCVKMWEKLLPGFAEKYKVILYDRRGFGESEKGNHFREYYLSDRYSDNSVTELSALLGHLNIQDPVHIVGQCEGGAIGFFFASQYPEQVKTITASSTLCYSRSEMSEFIDDKNLIPFEDTPPDYQEKLIDWHGATYAKKLYSLFMEIGGAYGSKIFDLRGLLTTIECPALLLYPDRSGLFDVDQGVLMYKSLPNGELAVLPNCGHNTYEDQPEEYQRHIVSFLGKYP